MKITFEKKKKDSDHLVIVYSGNLSDTSPDLLLPQEKIYLKVCSKEIKRLMR